MDSKKYWSSVKEARESLPEADVFMVSIEDPTREIRGGVVVEMSRENAAKAIVARTHRQAEEDEIEAYKADQAERRERIRAEEARRRGLDLLAGYTNGRKAK